MLHDLLVGLLLAAFAVGGAVLGLTDCVAVKEETAEATYAGQQLECVAESHSLGESKKCRAEVDLRWHRDGGTDAR